jgi:hypothetical protein
MAQPTVTISAPQPNESIDIPYPASGTASVSPGRTLTSMGYSINSGPINSITPSTNWSFQLTVSDCPTIGAHYLLSVYAADDQGQFGSASVNFTRKS